MNNRAAHNVHSSPLPRRHADSSHSQEQNVSGVGQPKTAAEKKAARAKLRREERERVIHVIVNYVDEMELGEWPIYEAFVLQTRFLNANPWFNGMIVFCIVLAGVLSGVATYGSMQRDPAKTVVDTMDSVILIIFTFECTVKILAEGTRPWRYICHREKLDNTEISAADGVKEEAWRWQGEGRWKKRDHKWVVQGWNIFDFIIVALSWVPSIPNLAVFRALRLLRLVNAIRDLKLLVNSLFLSFGAIANVVMLLLLAFYIFCVMAVFLFKDNDPLHFRSLEVAIVSLYRAATFEDWTDIMYINMFGCDKWGYSEIVSATEVRSPDSTAEWYQVCNRSDFGSEVDQVVGAFFYCTFSLVASMVIFSVFVAVISTGMEEAEEKLRQQEQEARLREQKKISSEMNAMDQFGHNNAVEKQRTVIAIIKQRLSKIVSRSANQETFDKRDTIPVSPSGMESDDTKEVSSRSQQLWDILRQEVVSGIWRYRKYANYQLRTKEMLHELLSDDVFPYLGELLKKLDSLDRTLTLLRRVQKGSYPQMARTSSNGKGLDTDTSIEMAHCNWANDDSHSHVTTGFA